MKPFPFLVWLTSRISGIDKSDVELKYRRLFTWLKLYCRHNFFFWAAITAYIVTLVIHGIDTTRCLSAKNLVMVNILLFLLAVEIDFIVADRLRHRYPFFFQVLHSDYIFRRGNTHHGYLKFKSYLFLILFLLGAGLFAYFELRFKGNCSGTWIMALRAVCLIFLIQTLLLMVDALVEGRD